MKNENRWNMSELKTKVVARNNDLCSIKCWGESRVWKLWISGILRNCICNWLVFNVQCALDNRWNVENLNLATNVTTITTTYIQHKNIKKQREKEMMINIRFLTKRCIQMSHRNIITIYQLKIQKKKNIWHCDLSTSSIFTIGFLLIERKMEIEEKNGCQWYKYI